MSTIRPIQVPGSSPQEVNRQAARRDAALGLARGQIFNPAPNDLKLSNVELASLSTDLANQTLSESDVGVLLDRASAVSASRDAIIVVVDRGGNILGVRVEDEVSAGIQSDPARLTFAVDGAVSLARTGAFFANNQAPLTSRTVQFISQTSMTERVVNSTPNGVAADSSVFGPGFVAPIGAKGHFPPNIAFTPQVDLLGIEYTNRDSVEHPGNDGLRGTADDISLPNRFNVPDSQIPLLTDLSGQFVDIAQLVDNGRMGDPTNIPITLDPKKAQLYVKAPESWGFVSGTYPEGQSRGMATLPGGIPIYKNGTLVGGIGVFFPGETGFATEENAHLNDAGFFDSSRPDRSLEAEYIAFVAVGGIPASSYEGAPPGLATAGPVGDAPALPGVSPRQPNASKVFGLPFGRIDLVGITLPLFGGQGLLGPQNLLFAGSQLKLGEVNGTNRAVDVAGATLLSGEPLAGGWLAKPIDAAPGAGDLTAADIENLVDRSIVQANVTRSAIRLPLSSTSKMTFSASDRKGNVLGIYRMLDSTFFSIDVAVAKARNVSYYADPAELQPADQVPGLPRGAAFTSRTFRYLTLPYFPEGINTNRSGPFSILNSPNTARNGRNQGPPLPASSYDNVQARAAFYPADNFQDPTDIANQNGVIFFPGSQPLYRSEAVPKSSELIGGFGVSGDGVDQDDVVTSVGAFGYQPLSQIVPRADLFSVRGVRLPYMKFNRQPLVDPQTAIGPNQKITPPTRSDTAFRGNPSRYFPIPRP
jgi:uncharacterized protein GlcG (DUF336 family)